MVFLFAFILIILMLYVIYFSKIQIQIINFNFSSETKRHINKDYKIIIKWYIFNKIPIVKSEITKSKMEKLKLKERIKDVNFQSLNNQKHYDKKAIQALKMLDTNIQDINLNINIGTENAVLTSIVVPILSTIISLFLSKKVNNYNNQTFIINPIYLNQNILNVSLSGIFELKIRNIINIIYMLNKKEGVEKYERTSNRRAYDYSYE